MEDYYERNLNYNNFINKLKEKRRYDKFEKIEKNIKISNIETQIGVQLLEFNDNMLKLREDFLLKSPLINE
jgi:hypothetical protein